MLTDKTTIIFDMDGTLMDSMWMWKEIDQEYLSSISIPVPEDLQVQIEGMGFTETAVYFKERFQLPQSVDEIKAQWNEMVREKYATQVPLKPGAREFLEILQIQGYRLGIASSNSMDLVMTALRRNQVDQMFDCILTVCEVGKGKPSPDIYLEAARRLNADPKECLVFEDVPMGVLAGKNAGMTVCGVEDASAAERKEEVLRHADYYIHDFYDILMQRYEVLR